MHAQAVKEMSSEIKKQAKMHAQAVKRITELEGLLHKN